CHRWRPSRVASPRRRAWSWATAPPRPTRSTPASPRRPRSSRLIDPAGRGPSGAGQRPLRALRGDVLDAAAPPVGGGVALDGVAAAEREHQPGAVAGALTELEADVLAGLAGRRVEGQQARKSVVEAT